jgi:hypothetical protein
MLEVAVASALPRQIPAVAPDDLDDVTNLHPLLQVGGLAVLPLDG